MIEDVRGTILKEFRRIPGVGPRIAEDLWALGLRSVGELKGRNPEELYARLCERAGGKVDRCRFTLCGLLCHRRGARPRAAEMVELA